MLDQLKSALAAMNRKTRIGLVVSIVWLIVVMAVCLGEAREFLRSARSLEGHHVIDVGNFLVSYLTFGILPVVFSWGIVWIRSAK